jgi:hypothetical protein
MTIDVEISNEGARATVSGRTFEVIGLRGAVLALACKLEAAGVPDAPLHLHREGQSGFLAVQSFRQLAAAKGI